MQEKVARVGVQREKGFMYFLGQDGDIWRAGMTNSERNGVPKHKIAKVGVEREQGYLYFIDKQGDVSRAKMMHGRK